MNLFTLNRSAAEIAAAAFYETFPGTALIGGRRTSLGFSFDFQCSFPLPSHIETLIEEKLRQIVREKRPIRVLEMVPLSARAFLLKEGHVLRANEIEGERLVEIVQIGTFHNLSAGPHLSCSSQLSACKVRGVQNLGAGRFRLVGSAYPTAKELKQFLKRLREYPGKSHERIGIQKSLWCLMGDRVIWLPSGLKQIGDVVRVLKEQLFQGALEISAEGEGRSRALLHASFAKQMNHKGVAEVYSRSSTPWNAEMGLFAGEGGIWLHVSHYPSSSEEFKERVISSLQFAEKALMILGFQHRLSLKKSKRADRKMSSLLRALDAYGLTEEMPFEEEEEARTPRFDLMVKDALGRHWPAISIEMTSDAVLIMASVERLVALLLEMKISQKGNGERH